VSDCDDVPKVVEVLQAVSAFARDGSGDRLRVRMTQAAPAAVVRELDFQTIGESVAAAAAKPVPPTPKTALKAAMDKAIADSSDDEDDAPRVGTADGKKDEGEGGASNTKADPSKATSKQEAQPLSAAARTTTTGAAIPAADLDEFL
jgi:hypothetical protein